MVEIIPAINAEVFEEVERKIRLVESYVQWVHLDIADRTFTKNTLWHDARDLVGFETPLKIEVHLMIDRPEERIGEWFLPVVKRAIVHHETVSDIDFLLARCKEAGMELGVAIATNTPWAELKSYIGKVNFFQILAVHPGLAGQKFQEHNYDKIRHLRASCPSCTIEVDGGVSMSSAKKCIDAGADVLAVASAIFSVNGVQSAIGELQKKVL